MNAALKQELAIRNAECEALRAKLRALTDENEALRRIASPEGAARLPCTADPRHERAPLD